MKKQIGLGFKILTILQCGKLMSSGDVDVELAKLGKHYNPTNVRSKLNELVRKRKIFRYDSPTKISHGVRVFFSVNKKTSEELKLFNPNLPKPKQLHTQRCRTSTLTDLRPDKSMTQLAKEWNNFNGSYSEFLQTQLQ